MTRVEELREYAERYRRMRDLVPEEGAKHVLEDAAEEKEWQARCLEAGPEADIPPPRWNDF